MGPLGVPIIFIPGLLCDDRLWRDQAATLSFLTPCSVADVTLDDTVGKMATRLLESAPPKFVLVALSMGGYVAFETWRQAASRIVGMVLFDTSAASDTPSRAAERRASLQTLRQGRFVGVSNRLLPKLVDARHLDGPVGVELKAMATRVGGEAFVRQQNAILFRPDSRAVLSSISAPVLVGAGDRDVLTPPTEAIAIFQAVQRPTFHLFHRCGHLPAIEQPSETTGVLLRWLFDTNIPREL